MMERIFWLKKDDESWVAEASRCSRGADRIGKKTKQLLNTGVVAAKLWKTTR